MPWFKVDDHFHSNKKVLRIPRNRRCGAAGLWLLVGTWATSNLTNGKVPDYIVAEFGGTPQQVKDLVAAGLWEPLADDEHQYVKWAEYQPTREKVEEVREAERERKARQREAWKEKARREALSEHGVPDDVPDMSQWDTDETDAVSQVVSEHPDPTRPDPSRPETPLPTGESRNTPKPTRGKRHRLPDGWLPSEANREKIRTERPDLNLRVAHEDFQLYWKANGETKIDWDACWLRWMRNQKATVAPGRYEDRSGERPNPKTGETCTKPGHSGWARNCAQCRADALTGTPEAAPPSEGPRRDITQLGLIGKPIPA